MAPAAVQSKLRGGYYTPAPVADFLAWALVGRPSAGPGAERRRRRLRRGRRRGDSGRRRAKSTRIELHEDEASKIRHASRAPTLTTGDASPGTAPNATAPTTPSSATHPSSATRASRGASRRRLRPHAARGLRPNRLTNAWVPFVVLATRALRPGRAPGDGAASRTPAGHLRRRAPGVPRSQLQRADRRDVPAAGVRRHPAGDRAADSESAAESAGDDVVHRARRRRRSHAETSSTERARCPSTSTTPGRSGRSTTCRPGNSASSASSRGRMRSRPSASSPRSTSAWSPAATSSSSSLRRRPTRSACPDSASRSSVGRPRSPASC